MARLSYATGIGISSDDCLTWIRLRTGILLSTGSDCRPAVAVDGRGFDGGVGEESFAFSALTCSACTGDPCTLVENDTVGWLTILLCAALGETEAEERFELRGEARRIGETVDERGEFAGATSFHPEIGEAHTDAGRLDSTRRQSAVPSWTSERPSKLGYSVISNAGLAAPLPTLPTLPRAEFIGLQHPAAGLSGAGKGEPIGELAVERTSGSGV
jgi:hypothetical protein